MYWRGLLSRDNAPVSFMLAVRLVGLLVGYSLFGIFGALVGAFVTVFLGVFSFVAVNRVADACRLGMRVTQKLRRQASASMRMHPP